MIRMFQTHEIRPQQELSGSMWEFTVPGHEPRSVWVPSCWETYPGFESYRGTAAYTTHFTAGGTIRLECKGVSHTADVFIDGRKVAHHYNAYTPFSAVVTGLDEGEHLLEIRVDNRFTEDSALHIPNDYMSYGGVTRPVVLEKLSGVYIEKMRFDPSNENGVWSARITASIANPTDETQICRVRAQAADVDLVLGEVIVPPHETFRVSKQASFPEVRAWCFEDPALYLLKLTLSCGGKDVDDLIERVGFRTISVKGKEILLNGRAVRIKGICRHEDHPHYGCALPASAMAYDLNLLKDLGANSVRTSHYPNDEIFLDMCDEAGMLVWEESHARAQEEEQMRHPLFEKQSEDCICEMIENHYNHPCIYIWGILNECMSQTEFGYSCYKKQFDLIRSLDSSRLCSFASCMFFKDICFGLPDVVSYNIYPQWYHDTPSAEYLKKLYDWVQESTQGAGKPFLISEIGAGGIYGFRTPSLEKWSEEYQVQALRDQIAAVFAHPDCSGVYLWQFCDVRVSREWFAKRPRSMNNKGIVDEYRHRKLCYDTVKALFWAQDDYR